MKLHYYQETDSFYVDLVDRPSVDSQEIRPGVVLDFDAEGNLVGVDIDRASKIMNLARLEIEELPVSSVALT